MTRLVQIDSGITIVISQVLEHRNEFFVKLFELFIFCNQKAFLEKENFTFISFVRVRLCVIWKRTSPRAFSNNILENIDY